MTKYKIKNRTKEILNMLFEENGNKTKKEKKKREEMGDWELIHILYINDIKYINDNKPGDFEKKFL